jgi:hypothetical protein
LSGILKSIRWEDSSSSSGYNLSGKEVGWGFNLGAVIHTGKKITLKAQGVYGSGIENYIADASIDVGLGSNPGDPSQPVKPKPLPVWGFFSFAEISWSQSLRSSIGYSELTIQNADLQLASDFRRGQYGLVNLRYYPTSQLLVGIEYQFGKRENFKDGFHTNGNKIQLSFELNFSHKFIHK